MLFLQWSNWFKRFWGKVVKNWQKDYNEIDIYYLGYVTIKKIGDYNNINRVNPLYLMINEMIGHSECNSVECNSNEEKKMKIST